MNLLSLFTRCALMVMAAGLVGCVTSPSPEAKLGVAATPSIIPAPMHLQWLAGGVRIAAGVPVLAPSGDLAAAQAADYLVLEVARLRGLALTRADTSSDAVTIRFAMDAQAPLEDPEAYRIDVDAHGISARARTPQGLFYAAVTIAQLLSPDTQYGSAVNLASMVIEDAPRFRWRGAMIDVARHFLSVDEMKRIIDAMAQHKLNVLHWHLTDDQGWRVQINQYPRLTEVGAWRTPAGPAAAADIDTATGQARRYGGYYSQAQIRDVVAYAAARQVSIVPEIDTPGHAQAVIAAYPELGTGEHPSVSSDWGVHTYILNVDEGTMTFMENVLDEVMELFPGRYIHVGGDEAVKDRWKTSATVQQRMRQLGVKDEAALQAWFMRRLEDHLAKRGRTLVGWDEILEGGLPPAATVMSWRGRQGAIDAARLAHDVVLAPSPDLYLDNAQSGAADEPPGRPHRVSLADVYAFEPVPAELDATQARHVLGAQANAWSEHMRTPQQVEHALFPRIAALAEVDWSPRESRDWKRFVQAMPAQFERYRRLGVDVADSAFAVAIGAEASADGSVRVSFANQAGAGEIRYTLDGSEPRADSLQYRTPLQLTPPQTLRATSFISGTAMAAARTRRIDTASLATRHSDELSPCREGGLPLRLGDDAPLDGPRRVFNVDIFDACWLWPQARLDDVASIAVEVGNIPYNFQLWHDIKNVVVRRALGADGELQVYRDGCEGPLLAQLPLTPALSNFAVTTLRADLPLTPGLHDLCFRFGRRSAEILWAIDSVRLLRAGP